MAQDRPERPEVERGEPREEAVHRLPDPPAALDLEELRAAHRGEGERLEERDQDGHRDGDAELEEELADDPLQERDRKEDRDDGERRRGGREGDLARADGRRLHLPLAHLAVPVDVLEHHDGVVDDDADDERQAEHRVGVEREAEEVDDDERPEDRGRDGEQDVHGRRPRPEEEPADEAGQERREDEREEDLVDRPLDERRRVPVHVELEALGQLGLQDGELRLDVAPHLDGVGAPELRDAEPDRRLAHGAHEPAAVLEAVLDDGDVLQADRRAGRVGDDEVAERRDVDRLALGADVHLALGPLDPPGRHLLVLPRDGAVHVEDGEAVGLEPRRVVPDADVAVAEAEDVDLADALDHLQLGPDDVPDVVGEEDGGPVPGEDEPDDRLVLGVRLGDVGSVDLAREVVHGPRDLRLDVLQRRVDVAPDGELEREVRAPLPGRRRHLLDALDGRAGVLEDVDDVGLHDLGRGALQRDPDAHDRVVDVGVLADAEALEDVAEAGVAEDAEADQGDHEDPGEDVVADRDVREGHPVRDLLRVLRVGRGMRFGHHGTAVGAREPAAPAPAPFSADATASTARPSERRSEPSVTIVSPAASPETISTEPSPVLRPIWTVFACALPSATT